jgi:hypothetical protein
MNQGALCSTFQGVVDIEHNALGRLPERTALPLDQRPAKAQQARTSGRFSSREIVDCGHNSSSDPAPA